MPRKKHATETEPDDDLEDDEEDDEEEDEEIEDAINRDYLMARVGAALASAKAVVEACTDILAVCVNPDDDAKGKERKQLLADALEAAGASSRALEDAETHVKSKDVDPAMFELGEPWEEES